MPSMVPAATAEARSNLFIFVPPEDHISVKRSAGTSMIAHPTFCSVCDIRAHNQVFSEIPVKFHLN
jgi:hypothetical protein